MSDTRHILKLAEGPDSVFFDDPLPFLPPMENLAAALNKGADICEKRAIQQQGQRSAGIYEARARCVREIKEFIRGRVPVKAIATLLTAIGDADGRDVEVTTASLKMALHAEETQNVERR